MITHHTSRCGGSFRAILLALGLGCFGIVPASQAVDPPPDGGYPNGNTAEGEDALLGLTAGENNTAAGFHALFNNGAGDNNTAVGSVALLNNTDGLANTAAGADALQKNTTGDANTAVGVFALFNNSRGSRNVAVGAESLKRNTGSDNIGVGYEAGMNVGAGSNTICIGHPGVTGDNKTIRIGTIGTQTNTFIAGVNGVTVAGGVAVVVDADGHLGTRTSSARYKQEIKPMNKMSEAIFALNPVTFRYNDELDPDGIPQFGLVAEDVEKVDPTLIARDEENKPYSVRYEAVNAMLLNEFLKEHRQVAQQAAMIARLKAELQATAIRQQKQIDSLNATLHNLSAQARMPMQKRQTSSR
jgi:hypothetical protein